MDREKLKQKILDRWSGQTVFAVADDLSDYILRLQAEQHARSKALRDALQRTLNLLGDIGQMDTPDFPVYQDACKLIAAHDADKPPKVWEAAMNVIEMAKNWGGHAYGCCGVTDEKDCDCGWKEVNQALRAYKEASGE